jgi:hypothetical protein
MLIYLFIKSGIKVVVTKFSHFRQLDKNVFSSRLYVCTPMELLEKYSLGSIVTCQIPAIYSEYNRYWKTNLIPRQSNLCICKFQRALGCIRRREMCNVLIELYIYIYTLRIS